MRHVADLVEGAAETDPSVVVDALGVAPCIADAPDARAFVVRAFAPSRATTSPTPTHSSSRRGGGNSAPAHTAHPWVIAGSKVADRRRLTVACVKSARTAVLRDLAEREARGGDLTTPCEVTRAMIAKHLTWVPGEMREAVNGDVVRLLQAAADRARAHRSDPQAALLYWSTRLAVYREFGLEKFGSFPSFTCFS
ncbi:hypothetical protein BC828DRAFT_170133 [Blastocladiella britannica]|nr:hypothetical protein BC828DRAFT_170133 [Blastocladiella britannica]